MELSSLIFSHVSQGTCRDQKVKKKKNTLKKFLIFREMELPGPKLKKHLIFQEGTCKAQKTNKKLLSFFYYCIHYS